jgi:hypothetical protein
VACQPSLHLSIPLTHAQYFVGLAGSTYRSGCHTWNLTTPHTAKLLSSFRADILLYAGVPSRLQHVHGKQKKCMVSGLGPSTSSRQNISLGFAANHRVGACRAATLAIRPVTREPRHATCASPVKLSTLCLDRNNFSGTQRARTRNWKAAKGSPLSTCQAAMFAVRINHLKSHDPFHLPFHGITVTRYSTGETLRTKHFFHSACPGRIRLSR